MEEYDENIQVAANHQHQHEDAMVTMESSNNYDYNNQELLADHEDHYFGDYYHHDVLGVQYPSEIPPGFDNYNNQELLADQDQNLRDHHHDVPGVQYLMGLPPGFVFAPSDQELLSFYLKKKIQRPDFNFDGMPFIPDANVYGRHPQDLLAGIGKNSGYFFTWRTQRYAKGKRPTRTVEGHGYWRMSGGTETIKEGGRNVGEKSSLVFNIGLQSDKPRISTNWLMKEYHIADSEWVLCEIYLKGHGH
ncbi:hypothetical protein MKW98_008530 [Papaver atlanticum]|uniref:NAC domain-containing protein n=1 Tax=Papaver atlanticum TaxID=357466 RepID=A0AAD4TCZ2_9MAGN|nr:hypothetical protein MKW98_008530 [Papaver atlanticum]